MDSARQTPRVLNPPSPTPQNAYGVDIVIAVKQVCDAWVSLGSSTVCNLGTSYALSDSIYYYAGTAAELNMQGSGACAVDTP